MNADRRAFLTPHSFLPTHECFSTRGLMLADASVSPRISAYFRTFRTTHSIKPRPSATSAAQLLPTCLPQIEKGGARNPVPKEPESAVTTARFCKRLE